MTDKLEAVILDWAGTTLDYGCYAPAVVFVDVFKTKGVNVTIPEARVPMGAHKKVHIRKLTELPSVREEWKRVHGSYPTENDVDEMFADFVPKQMDCLADYADLIPGTIDALHELRMRDLKVGSTTGYTGEMMSLLLSEAEKRGYTPEVSVCSTGDIAVRQPDGQYDFMGLQGPGKDWNISRPKPGMCILNAMLLGVENSYQCVKVGDTLPDIKEGLRAGMWTIGLAMTGNEIGLNEEEIEALPVEKFGAKIKNAYQRMEGVGAHYVVDGIWDVPRVIDTINHRIANKSFPDNIKY